MINIAKLAIVSWRSGLIIPPSVKVSLNTKIHRTSRLQGGVDISGTTVAKYSYICKQSRIVKARVGSFTSIGANVQCHFGLHPIYSSISSSPAFSLSSNELDFSFVDRSCFVPHKFISSGFVLDIGSDVWIGDHVKILDGIKIGHGAVVGAW